jgi:hypothetical protein
VILDFGRAHPKSFFVAYCLNRIAMEQPTAVTQLPPGLVTYRAYARVLRSRLETIDGNGDVLSGLFRIILTNDLTTTHAGLVCYRMADPSLAIQIDERLQRGLFRALFEHVMLRLDNCDSRMMDFLTGNQPLTHGMITLVEV